MAITPQITCDVCGKQKQKVNRWWLGALGNGFTLQKWSDEIANVDKIKHFCGQTCVIQAVNKFMSDLGGK